MGMVTILMEALAHRLCSAPPKHLSRNLTGNGGGTALFFREAACKGNTGYKQPIPATEAKDSKNPQW